VPESRQLQNRVWPARSAGHTLFCSYFYRHAGEGI